MVLISVVLCTIRILTAHVRYLSVSFFGERLEVKASGCCTTNRLQTYKEITISDTEAKDASRIRFPIADNYTRIQFTSKKQNKLNTLENTPENTLENTIENI